MYEINHSIVKWIVSSPIDADKNTASFIHCDPKFHDPYIPVIKMNCSSEVMQLVMNE